MKTFGIKNSFMLAIVAGAMTLQSCSRNPVTGKNEVILMSEEQEIALGAQSHPSIVATMGIYDDARLNAFINEKGKAMAAISHRPNLPYQFFIVDSPVVNAFAVPGGYVYFTRGIMAHFNSTAEFTGVLGHEIGHITARHSARQQTTELFGTGALILGSVFLDKTGGQLTEAAAQGLQLALLGYSRAHESESDQIGVVYSSKIGYDAKQMAQFFGTIKRISDKSGQQIPTFMSTHPDPGDRLARVSQLAQQYQAENPGNYQVDRDNYLRMIDGIIYGEDPKQGFVENNMFYHPEMRFQFPVPRGWKSENSPVQFQMADPNGKSMMVLTTAEGQSLQDAAQKTLQQINAKVLQNQSTTINGIPAIVVISQLQQDQQQQTQQQQQPTMQVASWFLQYGNSILVMHGLAYAQDFNQQFNTFNAVASNFRQLTDPDKLNRKPVRIRIKTVQRAGTFSDVMRSFGMPNELMDDLAILNQVSLNTPIQQGTLIKTISK
jgi:predicted Zn-dependent protease